MSNWILSWYYCSYILSYGSNSIGIGDLAYLLYILIFMLEGCCFGGTITALLSYCPVSYGDIEIIKILQN
jgi:hypothetical protein